MLQSQSVYCAVLPYSSVHSCVHEVKRERMVIVAAMAFSMEVLIASMAFSVMLPVALALVLTWCGYLVCTRRGPKRREHLVSVLPALP